MARLISSRYIHLNSIPGSIQAVREESSSKLQIQGMSWNSEDYSEFSLNEQGISNWENTDGYCHWIDITGFRRQSLLQALKDRFTLHPLTMEDLANPVHGPKFEDFPEYRFLVLKMLRLDGEKILSEQLNIIQWKNLIISFQEAPGDVFDEVRRRIRSGGGRIRRRGSDYTLFTLLDAVVDNYIEAVESFGTGIEDFEDSLFDRQDRGVISEIRRAKNVITEIRRYSMPLAEAVNAMLRRDESPLDESDTPFYHDLSDHITMVNNAVNGYRELLREQLNLYTALQNYRLSEVMKVLTVISTIFIPLTFLAGIYGMNFRHMPELDVPYAYPLLLGIMAVIAIAMLMFFRRRGWLGGSQGRKRKRNKL